MNARIARWTLPAAGVTMGAAALAVLLGGEALERASDRSPAPGAPAPAATLPGPAVAALHAPPTPAPPPPTPSAGRAAPPPAPAPTPVDPRRHPVETAALLGASGELAALARAGDLPARLAWLDARVGALTPTGAARLLSALVDAPLPGDRYEAESLRLAALARLGTLAGPEVDAVLLARLDPERPRPERLVTLELLAARPDLGQRELQHLIDRDHDPVVREKARWALRMRGWRG